jgi:hypothetical protein
VCVQEEDQEGRVVVMVLCCTACPTTLLSLPPGTAHSGISPLEEINRYLRSVKGRVGGGAGVVCTHTSAMLVRAASYAVWWVTAPRSQTPLCQVPGASLALP